MRTIILCILLTSGILGLSFSCCTEENKYWNITSVQASLHNYPDSTTQVTEDTLALRLAFGIEFLALEQATFINPFINSSYATSCPDPGYEGMKDELTNIKVTSSANFNSYPPGISLDPIISIYGQSVEDFILSKRYNYDYYYQNYWVLNINQKPATSSNIHDFKITLTFASGRTEEIQMGAITWN